MCENVESKLHPVSSKFAIGGLRGRMCSRRGKPSRLLKHSELHSIKQPELIPHRIHANRTQLSSIPFVEEVTSHEHSVQALAVNSFETNAKLQTLLGSLRNSNYKIVWFPSFKCLISMIVDNTCCFLVGWDYFHRGSLGRKACRPQLSFKNGALEMEGKPCAYRFE